MATAPVFDLDPQDCREAEGPASQLQHAIAGRDRKRVDDVIEAVQRYTAPTRLASWLVGAMGDAAFEVDAIALLPKKFVRTQVEAVLVRMWSELRTLPEDLVGLAASLSSRSRLDLGRLLVLRGEAERARDLRPLPRNGSKRIDLLAAFFEGDYKRVAFLGGQIAGEGYVASRDPQSGVEAALDVLARLAEAHRDPGLLSGIEKRVEIDELSMRRCVGVSYLEVVCRKAVGDPVEVAVALRDSRWVRESWEAAWMAAVHDLWLEAPTEPAAAKVIESWHERAVASGYRELAPELRAAADAIASGLPATAGIAVAAKSVPQPWQTALARLAQAGADDQHPHAEGSSTPHAELLWMFELGHGGWGVQPRIRKSGRSKKGRAAHVFEIEGSGCTISAADDTIIAALMHRQLRSASYDGILRALVGHPRVVDTAGAPLVVEAGTASLHTTRVGEGVHIGLSPAWLVGTAADVLRPEPGRLVVFGGSEALARVVNALTREGSTVPEEGVPQLLATLGRLAAAGIVQVTGDVVPGIDEVEAEPRTVVSLDWDGVDLEVRATVAPAGLAGRHVGPGEGGPDFVCELRTPQCATLVRCRRDLVAERRAFEDVLRACPTLGRASAGGERWKTGELDHALGILGELEALGEAIILAWPKGRKLQRARAPLDLQDLALHVASKVEWLEVSGSVEVSEGEVVSFEELLAARAGDSYVALGHDRFVALSSRLRRQLEVLERLGTCDVAGFRMSLETLRSLRDLADAEADLEIAFDAAALARLERLEELALAQPKPPPEFRATLREYQLHGYQWAWRLSQAGLGACLADDMGLGKTIQALALLVERAPVGPALVICPTSVTFNWVSEAQKFAPGLTPTLLADAHNRAAAIGRLGPGDLAICSYGMLGSEAEALQQASFGTIVLDEAHYLKNDRTFRARAAAKLRAGFIMALTGTPIENRTKELRSLFAILVPGLLGSREQFFERFAGPIETGNEGAVEALRTIIRPFVLRRTKESVLSELPPRTDATILVSPSAEAKAFYEALRRTEEARVEAVRGPARMPLLFAALTRLRQTAVDPRLLDQPDAPAGAKIGRVVKHVVRLAESGHRTLVFTQYLQCMQLLGEGLSEAGVSFVTLDGSMSVGQRSAAVASFQRGDVPVFMLSLRAGGVGMNLTAADHVVHVDPWWNPAVEDQATDRAHRIGQTRPVTVSRFITEGTVEEKMLALHEKKRDLAEAVVGGMSSGSPLDMKTLESLLR